MQKQEFSANRFPGAGRSVNAPATPVGGIAANLSEHQTFTNSLAGKGVTGTVTLASASSGAPPAPLAYQSRQVIRKADLDIRVENVEKAERAANAIIDKVGGYTDSASSTDLASTHPELTMTARIPVATFDTTIAKFEALGVRLSKTINSEDVTGHIVDMDAQLKTLRIQADIYRNMLKGRTQLSEVFEIQQQLTQVQTQIEDIDSRRKTEAGQAALSTVTLKLEQNGVVSLATTDPGWMAQSWAASTSGASGALRAVTVVGMWILCFAPFWIPLALVVRRLLKGVGRPSIAPPVQTP